jgi:hypothetical protein
MESAVQVDSNFRLQIVIYSTTAVSVNVSYRERVNGNVRQPRQTNIAAARITTDVYANYFYYTFAGNATEISELLNVAIGLSTTGVQRGQCFVRAGITIGGTDGAASDPIQILFSDYVTSNSFLAYPGTGINDSYSGNGYLFTKRPADPVAPDYEYIHGDTTIYKINAISFEYETDDNVANRTIYAKKINQNFNDSFIFAVSPYTQADSLINKYSLQVKTVQATATIQTVTNNILEIPHYLYLNSGDTIYISAENAAAGDLISDISIVIEQWIKA